MLESPVSETKQSIIKRIRDSKLTRKLPDPDKAVPHMGDMPPIEEPELLKLFKKELENAGVEYYHEPDAGHVRNRLQGIIHGKPILSWYPGRLPYEAGALLENENVSFGNDPRQIQAQAEIGLTGCDAAIAETGSLVLQPGKGKSRAASLLPYVHVALVKKGSVHYNMRAFFNEVNESGIRYSHINIITGPSRTADIELTLTIGVHGPGRVVVIIGP